MLQTSKKSRCVLSPGGCSGICARLCKSLITSIACKVGHSAWRADEERRAAEEEEDEDEAAADVSAAGEAEEGADVAGVESAATVELKLVTAAFVALGLRGAGSLRVRLVAEVAATGATTAEDEAAKEGATPPAGAFVVDRGLTEAAAGVAWVVEAAVELAAGAAAFCLALAAAMVALVRAAGVLLEVRALAVPPPAELLEGAVERGMAVLWLGGLFERADGGWSATESQWRRVSAGSRRAAQEEPAQHLNEHFTHLPLPLARPSVKNRWCETKCEMKLPTELCCFIVVRFLATRR